MQTVLTAEQLEKAETMSLDELRQLAIKEASGEVTEAPKVDEQKTRDAKGRFTNAEDVIDNSSESDKPTAEVDTIKEHHAVVEDGQPTRTVYIRKIDNEDGSGVDVYEAETLEELVDKIAEGKANANKKIRELNSRVKVQTAAEKKSEEDLEYIVAEKLKTNPKQAIKEVLLEVQQEEQAKTQRALHAQDVFVATHPDYKKSVDNGNKLMNWVKSHGYAEFTVDNLEKAYQDLKKSGLLVLEAAVANDATDVKVEDTHRTDEPKAEATQQRSQSRGSTISSRGRSTTAARVNALPTEDEAYAMPLEKLKDLANKQLATNQTA
jgi:hypothetical protein